MADTGTGQPGVDLAGKRVLIVRLSALGDVIRTLPAVTGLQKRFPSATFFWLVEKPSAGLLKALAGVEVVAVDRKRLRKGLPWQRWSAFQEVRKRIQALQIDVSIDFHGVLKSGVFPLLAGIPIRIGYERGGSKEGHRWLIHKRFAMPKVAVSRYERNASLAQFIDSQVQPHAPDFKIEADEASAIAGRMAERPIVFFPGTSAHGRNKRWPAAYWALLYRRVTALHPVHFIFGPDDGAYRTALERELGSDLQVQPPLSLPALAHTLKASRMLVSCDTGPLHLAAVLQVPVVAMLGPSDPVLNQPQTPLREVVLPGVACAPCRNRDCQVLICQDATTPQRVWEAVTRLLERIERQGS